MAQEIQRQKVWDAPTRLLHWLLVGLIGFSWWSAKTHHMDWHRYSGAVICGLIIFRVLWGFVGPDTSRFAYFLKGPRAVWSYVRPIDGPIPVLGHNPLGGWSVLALVLAMATQVGSGVFAVDVDGIELGPLSYLVDFDHGRLASAVHRVTFNVLLGLVLLHLAAIVFYLVVKRRNLTWAMITGFQPAVETSTVAAARFASRWRLAGTVIVSVLLAYGVAVGFRF